LALAIDLCIRHSLVSRLERLLFPSLPSSSPSFSSSLSETEATVLARTLLLLLQVRQSPLSSGSGREGNRQYKHASIYEERKRKKSLAIVGLSVGP
jgi:hypothetical protein